MSIAFKESFIERYLEKLRHKVEQELKAKLPDSDYFCNMVDQADEIVRELYRKK
jgi:hypothetical protein